MLSHNVIHAIIQTLYKVILIKVIKCLDYFKKNKETLKTENKARCYIGVAAAEYGADYDLTPLVLGILDKQFQTEILFNFLIGNKKFENFAEAMKYTSRRGVSSNSAYVIGLKCSIDEVDEYRNKGELSNLITSITNAITKEPVTENSELLKPKRNDDNSYRPQSPTIKI